jgi:trimethylamine:corrinoid methyltransferase-like protein
VLDASPTYEQRQELTACLGSVFRRNLHGKRIRSVSSAKLGVITSASLPVCTIGQVLAQARGLTTKDAIRQVDLSLTNSAIHVWEMFADWVREGVSNARDIAR